MTTETTTVVAPVTTDANAELLAQLAALRAENAKLKAVKTESKLSIRVSAKGAVSVYGVGRWPVTLYKGQMEKLLAEKDTILKFIEDNAHALSVKPTAQE